MNKTISRLPHLLLSTRIRPTSVSQFRPQRNGLNSPAPCAIFTRVRQLLTPQANSGKTGCPAKPTVTGVDTEIVRIGDKEFILERVRSADNSREYIRVNVGDPKNPSFPPEIYQEIQKITADIDRAKLNL